jgi:PTH1 family peptidyl-tRNA hydrolase
MFSFKKWWQPKPIDMKKFLLVGLGNIGATYANTRHNIGFDVVDALAKEWDLEFETGKSAFITRKNFKGKSLVLIKPTTLMNRSGKAVRYWALKENIALQNILVITDDLHLPFGSLRMRGKGSSGGHNGLKDIEALLNTPNYPRLRFGIGQENKRSHQIDFVLGEWDSEEQKALEERIERAAQMSLSFVVSGVQNTMNQFNGT